MRNKTIFKTLLLSILIVGFGFLATSIVSAQNPTSTNYQLLDLSLNAGGSTGSSTNYSLLSTAGDFTDNPAINSTTYKIKGGVQSSFLANVPTVSCFETTTNGSSSCTTGPSYLNTNGMYRVCGNGGCYNRARFEINGNGNPTDTLYAVQISTDNFASDIKYIDGTSFEIETSSTRTLADYLSESAWESPTFNIKGLTQNTQYWIRVTALHGNFTESDPSSVATATTANAIVTFDIDIAPTTGTATETAGPYVVDLGQVIRNGLVKTGPNLIWFDAETNANGGIAVVQRGTNGGLKSSTTLTTITSATADLSSAAKGFGIQSYYTAQSYQAGSGQGNLGTLTGTTNYIGAGDNVGIVATTDKQIYYATLPLYAGRGALYVKAKADGTVPTASNYTEDITFTVAGLF
jgi:hypothetical protein